MFRDDARLNEVVGEGREIDRRTIAKGVAWTVPVVIVATAAPAAAASGAVTLDSATYVPIAGSDRAKIAVKVKVDGGTKGLTITFSGLSQNGPSIAIASPNSFQVKGIQTLSIETDATAAPAAVTSVLSYSMTGGYGGSALSVPVSSVSKVTAATRSGNGSGGSSSTQTFTFTVSPKDASSAMVITSMTSAATKVGDPAGAWTQLSQTTWADLGSGVVTFTAKQPSGNYAASATISGTVDGVPFTVTSN